MVEIKLMPLALLAQGSHILGPVYIPDGVKQMQLKIRRCTPRTPHVWPLQDVKVSWGNELCKDDEGVIWNAGRLGSASGGLQYQDDGTPEEFSIGSVRAFPARMRWYRAMLVVEGGSLFSEISLSLA